MQDLRTSRPNFGKAKTSPASWRWPRFSSALLPHRIIHTARSAAQREIAASTQVRKPWAAVNDYGFTLVELLVVMVLIGILSLMLPNFIANWLQASSIAEQRTALLTDAEDALDTVTQDIRLSGAADQNNRWPDANAPGAPADELSWQSDSDTLVLAKAATDSSRNIIFSDPAKYISQKDNVVYYRSGSTLYRRTIKSSDSNDAAITTCPPAVADASCPADKTVATGVTAFSVQYYDADENEVTPSDAKSVQLAITLQNKYGSKTLSASYNTRMVFRNE